VTVCHAPLSGIRVLDFTRMLAGPYMTMNLADLGAEVLKVEEPAKGDETRGFPPHTEDGESCFFTSVNRSKRSIAIDLRHPEGREVARALALQADILAENFRPNVMARYGLDYQTLRQQHRRLIYCSVTGYGHTSPLRDVGGYDPIAQAESGLMEMTGFADNAPVRAGGGIIDSLTGAMAGQAVLAALIARGSTGQGQFVDISLLDCTLAAMTPYAHSTLSTGRDMPRVGNKSVFMAPMDIYQCADGPVLLIASSDRQFRMLCTEVLQRPELVDDPRFRTMTDRLANRQDLDRIIGAALLEQPRQTWIDRMRPSGIVVGNVRQMSEALASPEVRARGMVVAVDGGERALEDYDTVGSPFFFSHSQLRPPGAAPRLGADTDDVLASLLSYSPAQIRALREAGAIGG
jgi:crotonobetainyl-CoA:carnitine CoA-transferase CaiB-like acyl-CoA transferase